MATPLKDGADCDPVDLIGGIDSDRNEYDDYHSFVNTINRLHKK